MTQRILLNTNNGLKVSRPGYDVASASAAQIAFASFGDPYAGVYLTGQSNSAAGGWTAETVYSSIYGAVAFTRLRKSIALGKTFSAAPQVIWTLRDATNPTSGDYAKYCSVTAGNNAGPVTCSGMVSWASCDTTTLTLRIDYSPSYGGNVSWIFSYMVFQT